MIICFRSSRLQKRWKRGALVVASLFALTGLSSELAAAGTIERQLAGAWAEPGNCSTTFSSKSGKWIFHEPRDMFGSGFIVVGNRYDGPFGTCQLSSTTQKGDKILLALSCRNSVGYSDQVTPIHFNSSTEVLVFSAMDGLSSTFKKCGL
jgi:hypothetical protein